MIKVAHVLDLGTLVAVLPYSHDRPNGLVGYVSLHYHDCDGTPLYGITLNPALVGQPAPRQPSGETPELRWKHYEETSAYMYGHRRGIAENSLRLVRAPTEEERREMVNLRGLGK